MSAGQIGNIVGIFVGSIVAPIIILIVCNFIPAAKRNPSAVYGVCGVLAVAVASVSQNVPSSVVTAILAALFLFWGYKRAAKKAALGASTCAEPPSTVRLLGYCMDQEPNPDDNSATLRASAEEDTVRTVLDRVLSCGEATDKFSGWVLAAAGGFISLQFSVASTVALHAPGLMLAAILITVVSLFIGAMVRLMVYNTDFALIMQGIDKRGGGFPTCCMRAPIRSSVLCCRSQYLNPRLTSRSSDSTGPFA